MTFILACLFAGVSPGLCDDFAKVRVRLINGSSIRATIESVDSAGTITGSANLSKRSFDEIISLQTGRESIPSPRNGTVALEHGGQIPFSSLVIKDESVEFASSQLNQPLPLELVRAIVWTSSEQVESAKASGAADSDLVVVATQNGERVVRGLVNSVSDTHVNINYGGKDRRIALTKVNAIIPAKISLEKPPGIFCNVGLVDGARLFGSLVQYRDGQLSLAVTSKHTLMIPANAIATITNSSERIVYLSDVQPIRIEQQSQFTVPREWQADRSILGNPIRLKYGSSLRVLDFEKGLGMRSTMSLCFANNSNFTHFRSVVGIAAETMGQGDCQMIVEGDGIRLWSKRVRGTDDPDPIVVEISDFQEVTLTVLAGEHFDLADHAIWADARFTKSN